MPTRNFMKTALAAGACALFAAPIAMADAINDWNERGVAAGYTARISPDMHSRCMAIMHLGMFEAVNAIEPRYTPYRTVIRADRGASIRLDAFAHEFRLREISARRKAPRSGPKAGRNSIVAGFNDANRTAEDPSCLREARQWPRRATGGCRAPG